MPNYRRVRIKGGTYFFTLVTYKRQKIFASLEVRELLLKSINHVKEFHPFSMIAYCVLLDHIHLLWQMPENEYDYSLRIAEIKKLFSKQYKHKISVIPSLNELQTNRGESGIWQRRFWEHYIRDKVDLNRHIDYIHYNPVKHGLVNRVRDWPSSSFFEYVSLGNYHIDWGEGYHTDQEKISFGE
ncbi:MAG: transposase [Chloroflexota bacterium]|nr:transposase [Chloroflexota bacterium]